jgi:hypothetical protein
MVIIALQLLHTIALFVVRDLPQKSARVKADILVDNQASACGNGWSAAKLSVRP